MVQAGIHAHMRTCPHCQRTFVCYGANEWRYKFSYQDIHLVLCSWHCLQDYRSKYSTIGERIDKAIEDGLNDGEIKKLLKASQRQVDKGRERAKIKESKRDEDRQGEEQ